MTLLKEGEVLTSSLLLRNSFLDDSLSRGDVLDILSPLEEFFFGMTLLQEGEVLGLLSSLKVLLRCMTLLQEHLLTPIGSFFLCDSSSPGRGGAGPPPSPWVSSSR
ncbi:UNVERIFIED_CONTAM: hypothetical protein Slati_0165300 [Sesamum latifolium]|uniref:Uncharacterized protein n=1 Tax=Sesamum latifolium TaxID=2727402 RepID=A0AAW2YAE1_9LAMI